MRPNRSSGCPRVPDHVRRHAPRPAGPVAAVITAIAVLAGTSITEAQSIRPAASQRPAAPVGAPASNAAATAPALSPSGASGPSSQDVTPSTIEETYDGWRVICLQEPAPASGRAGPGPRRCSVVLQQFDGTTRQRILAIELRLSGGEKTEGTAILPFGLVIERGVDLQPEAAPPLSTAKFRTCLPGGCVVPLSLDAKAVATLRKAQTLNLTAEAASGGNVILKVALKGFGPAFDRAMALAR
ncbi:invasion associated locus B family protein [Hyphomicrobiaceae bacterium 22]|uniref:Invasion associated locus B family protein n=2 Tax=Prosthecodimorpha staleyi TaxID=2840188 RepID=A0A947DBS8_9HYPH|nr:invasion associated locus B family protein [Prosthecodimorpha staleyi]